MKPSKYSVFTIAAKNYLAQAMTLGDSLKLIHPEIDFHIILADEAQGMLNLDKAKHHIIEAKNIDIKDFKDMAFKYDVLEFSCAIKPFCLEYLFTNYHYDKVLYLDPDVYVYDYLFSIFGLLDNHFLILTPHLTKPNLYDDGSTPENIFLFCGVYNLGFAGFSRHSQMDNFLNWWKMRMRDKAFVDKLDAFHVDQKWMDLVPSMYGHDVFISRYPGYNAAHWNMHERELTTEDGKYFMDGKPLIFYHFSSFDPKNPQSIAQRQTRFNLSNKSEYRGVYESYAEKVIRNQFDFFSSSTYAYSNFDDGTNILSFYRRLYRTLVEDQKYSSFISNPFLVSGGSFYELLRENGVLIYEKSKSGEYTKSDFRKSDRFVKWFLSGLGLLKRFLGFKYYHLLMRQFHKYSRSEEQIFLIRKKH